MRPRRSGMAKCGFRWGRLRLGSSRAATVCASACSVVADLSRIVRWSRGNRVFGTISMSRKPLGRWFWKVASVELLGLLFVAECAIDTHLLGSMAIHAAAHGNV